MPAVLARYGLSLEGGPDVITTEASDVFDVSVEHSSPFFELIG
jgi:hypothetical protein